MQGSQPSLNPDDLLIRAMRGSDLQQVLSIERNVQISPWSRLSFEESMTNPSVCRVVESSSTVVAFYIVRSVLDELHILNLAVALECQGHGLGHVLLDDVIKFADHNDLKKLFLEVRAGNQVAQGLYQKWQFKQIALRKNYYRGRVESMADPASISAGYSSSEKEDALIFVRQL